MCETEYEYCPYCRQYERQPKWRTLFDKADCQDVYYILSDWLGGRITQKEAREKLLTIDIKNIKFNETVQKNIDKIMIISDKELRSVHDAVDESDDIMDGINNIQSVLKNDKVFEKANDRKKQVQKIKPVSVVKSAVNKTAIK